jgi:AcrR family transcriptional regulator
MLPFPFHLPAFGGCHRPDRADRVRRERRDALEHRERLLAAAECLFARRGVELVNMSEIAREAGVGQGTLYRHFAHKGELALALLDGCVRDLQESVTGELGGSLADEPALVQLEHFFGRLLAFIDEHSAVLAAIGDEATGPRRAGFYRSPVYTWLHAVIVSLLERAVMTGEARLDDCGWTADALLASIDVDLYLFQRNDRGVRREQVSAGLGRLIAGLRTCTHASPPSSAAQAAR